MKSIGVKDPFLMVDYKQLLLYFDTLYITHIEMKMLEFRYDCFPEKREEIEQRIRDIQYLLDEGQLKLFDDNITRAILKNPVYDKRILSDKNFQKSIKLFNKLYDDYNEKSEYLLVKDSYSQSDFENLKDQMAEMGNIESRLKSRMLGELKKKNDVIPIIDGFYSPEATTKTKLINLTIENFPIPTGLVEWQAIIDFRDNEDSKLKRYQLIEWINQMAINPIEPKDFQLQLTILVMEYEAELKKHKIEYRLEIFKTIVKTSFAIAENFVKVKWSELLDPIFKIHEDYANLMSIEKKVKNQQIAYLMKSKHKFK